MMHLITTIALCLLMLRSAAPAADESTVTQALAVSLGDEGNHEMAALEFRRLALSLDDPTASGAMYWAAAYEYLRAGNAARCSDMLDRAEDNIPSVPEIDLLRAENWRQRHAYDRSGFFYRSILERSASADMMTFAARRLAALQVRQGAYDQAHAILANGGNDRHGNALASLAAYRRGSDKKPWLGGLLGLVPGLGYVYSGEYGNAVRSLILNSIFIYGMVDTADNGDWGAFGVITFFEITLYTGSIYGGIDAAHRYNHNRLQGCIQGIEGGSRLRTNLRQLPIVTVSFEF